MNKLHTQAITVLALAGFSSSASLRVCDPFLPELANTFHSSTGQAAMTISLFSVAYGLMQLVYGPLGDRYGKFKVISWATLCGVAGCVGSALSGSLWLLVSFRMLTGATAAALIPLSMAWIGDTVPYTERQATLARFLSGQIMGIVGGQLIGGIASDYVGWRYAFVILAALYAITAVLLFRTLRSNPVVSHTQQPHPHGQPRSAIHTLVSQWLIVLRTPWARVILITVFCEGASIFGAMAFLPAYLHTAFNLSLSGAGAVVSTFGLGGLLYALLSRKLVGRLGEKGLVTGGGLFLGGSFLLLSISPLWFLFIGLCFCTGIGFYMLHNTLQTNATQMVPALRGTAVSLFAGSFFLGQSFGVSMAARWMDSHGTQPLLMTSALLTAVVAGSFLYQLKRRPVHHATP